jgi:hypothetical protein
LLKESADPSAMPNRRHDRRRDAGLGPGATREYGDFVNGSCRIHRLLCLAGLWFLPFGSGAAVAAERPNIVLLLCDDLGYGDLGCFAHPRMRTPHLDRLVAEGVKLTHCYSSAPVCSPSRAGLLTGRVSNRLGIRDWIPADSGIIGQPGPAPAEEVTRPGAGRLDGRGL